MSIGIENQVVDAASIEVNRRLRHVKTDRLDGDRLLAKLIRHHAGERGGWSVVRVPSIEEEAATLGPPLDGTANSTLNASITIAV